MGRYLNPNHMTKESWLKTFATQAGWDIPTEHTCVIDNEPHTLAILMDNGAFTACALAYSREEMLALLQPKDPRFKYYYWVPNTHTYCFTGAHHE